MDAPAENFPEKPIDPITFEVLRNAFMSVVDEMGLMLERVAHSLVVSEGRDFSARHLRRRRTHGGRGEGRPAGSRGDASLHGQGRHLVARKGDLINEGDIVIMNDAFLGGTHARTFARSCPCIRDGEIIAFVQNSAHWSDAGGPVPGSFHAEATSTYGEALYIPPVHLVRQGAARRRGAAVHPQQRPRTRDHAGRRARADRFMPDRRGTSPVADRQVRPRADQGRDGRAHSLLGGGAAEGVPQAIPDGRYCFEDAIDFDPMGDRKTPVKIAVDDHDLRRPGDL